MRNEIAINHQMLRAAQNKAVTRKANAIERGIA